jgi:hypothetical protein
MFGVLSVFAEFERAMAEPATIRGSFMKAEVRHRGI